MAKARLTCENCGFDEEVDSKELKRRANEAGGIACSACGVQLAVPEDAETPKTKKSKPAQKDRYAGVDEMTGLDDVIEGDIPEDPAEAAEEPPAAEAPKARVFDKSEPSGLSPSDAGEAAQGVKKNRGMAGQSTGAARKKLKDGLRRGHNNPLFAAEMLDKFFRVIAESAQGKFDGVAAASVRIGHYVLLASAALSLIFGVLISLRSFSLNPLLTGAALAAFLLFAQYLALKSFDLLKGYIEKNPSRLPGAALADMLSALAVLVALLFLLTGLMLTVNYHSPVWLGSSALGVIVGYFAAAAFLACGSRLNVSFDDSLPAGNIFVELASTCLKAAVAVVPFVFGLGSAAMALCMIWPAVSMLLFSLNSINTDSFILQESGLLFCAFSPILAYILVLMGDFMVQFIRAILGDKR